MGKTYGGYTLTENGWELEPQEELEDVDLTKLTKAELVEMAEANGVEDAANMTKAELIDALAD